MSHSDPQRAALRTVRASVLGALGGSTVMLLTSSLQTADHGYPGAYWHIVEFAPLLMLGSTFATLLGTLFFGLPAMVLLRSAKAESLPAYLFAGALPGILLCALNGPARQSTLPYLIAYPVATAAAFWREVRLPALREEAGP